MNMHNESFEKKINEKVEKKEQATAFLNSIDLSDEEMELISGGKANHNHHYYYHLYWWSGGCGLGCW